MDLQPAETVSDGVKRIVDWTVTAAIEHIDGDMEPHETVHEVRKRWEEGRAAVRLVRPVPADLQPGERPLSRRRRQALRRQGRPRRDRDVRRTAQPGAGRRGPLRKSYERARDRMAAAYEDPEFEPFHGWRKRIKYHRAASGPAP